jgi:starch synthase
MKAGIVYADAVTTVSPNYAKEILTPEFGCGLEGFLQKHQKKIVGILNGIDLCHFSPKTDSALVQNYDAKSYGKKAENKKAYLKERGLEIDELPLFIFIGRFTWQKGIDLLVEVLKPISKMKLNLAILGDGESKYNQQIKAASSKCHNINLFFGYDESLSHRMYGAADFLLMPSQFEPCGLNQMISMHYGTLPIVHNVGGLKDSVHPISSYDSKKMCGFGIGFDEKNSKALLGAIKSALALYEQRKRFQEINIHNMSCDFSWNQSAEAYATLYSSILDDMS